MRVSVQWIRQYLSFDLPNIEDLERKIGAQLGAIEETEYLGDKYKGLVVARIVSCNDHPNADRLHVCLIDDGGKVSDITRDSNGYVQVVCGASNARAGILVVWLPPGSVVPETYAKEPFVLESRDFRGIMSNGMLASARELALGTDHTGIVELDETDIKPGDDFAHVFKLDDYIIDIENKMFTHRPDCFGELGVAREIAGILGKPFVSPDWYQQPLTDPIKKSSDLLPIVVRNELPQLVPRFMAAALHIGRLGPSPMWLRTQLSRVGLRPINNVVDITNYMMVLTGQPLHAYDYDKVKDRSGNAATLVVRYTYGGEKLTLLNGKEITPRPEAIMIATDKELIGVGGVMGGGDTEVDDTTRNIILECATFDMYSIRRTSMAHGLFTDAVSRFNKGQSPLQNDRVMAEALRLLGELAEATLASDVIDDNYVAGREWVHPPVPITTSFINERLGLQLSTDEMKRLLVNVECSVTVDGDNLTVTAPFWRTDIELREDVVEEIGRLYGYDHLPLKLPMRMIEPAKKDRLLDLKANIRAALSRAGANEVLTYSFVHGDLFNKVQQDRAHAFQLSNAISPDLQYYRLSLTPSLLDHVHQNIKAGYGSFALFELGRAHTISEQDADGVPREVNALSLVITTDDSVARTTRAGAPYYAARRYLLNLLEAHSVTTLVRLETLRDADLYGNPWIEQMVAPYEPDRSAVLRDAKGLIWGVVGEFKASVRKALKLPGFTAGFEVDPLLFMLAATTQRYVPLPRFPKIEQDICLKVDSTTTYRQVYEFVWQTLQDQTPERTLFTLGPVDIYQRADDQSHKQITVRLTIANYDRTMTDEEVAKLLDEVAAGAKNSLHAERI